MYGLVLEILESFILDHPRGGKGVWSTIKRKANCSVTGDQAFLRRSCYRDDELFALVHAAARVLRREFKTEADLLLAFGKYMIQHHYLNGYNDLLQANGATLRQWLSNLNSLHDHVAKSFEGSNSNAGGENNKSFQPPIYWCEDCEDVEGSILLHYFSFRGTLLVPMTVGIVQELAHHQFGIHVTMTQLALQGESIVKSNVTEDNGKLQRRTQEESECTTWRITATDPSQRWKLSPTVDMDDVIDFSQMEMPSKCPFSGRSLAGSSIGTFSDDSDDTDYVPRNRGGATDTAGLSKEQLTTIFPFHVLVDRKFTILQVGAALSSILGRPEETLTNVHIGDIFDIIRPVMGTAWDWQALKKLEDQQFSLVPCMMVPRKVTSSNRRSFNTVSTNNNQNGEDSISSIRGSSNNGNGLERKNSQQKLRRKVSMVGARIRFKGSMLELTDPTTRRRRRRRKRRQKRESKANGSMYHSHLDDDDDDNDYGGLVMFVLSPDANNVTELRHMGLTMTDLPLHTCQRDAVFLGEYISHEVNMAHNLDKLSKTLELEKNLSNTLLYNMLPKQIADDLRSGNTVAPEHHDNVTLFFSDVVGFTNICGQVNPWAIIDMLNQLYSVMDYLAEKMNLYKVETIGDAYMCCSGLPFADEHHAENIANFALAVVGCVKHVLSPADGKPIELRIGIHTGSCTSGVVGTLTPHYCLFGDMVNVTSRHESTGQPGKIQCSSELFAHLTQQSKHKEQFTMTPRGVVDMKGKGKRMTYWLKEGTKANKHSGPKAIQALYDEVGVMLEKQTWKMRQYFRSSGLLRGGDSDSQSLVSGSSGKTISTTGGASITHGPLTKNGTPDRSEADGNKPEPETDLGELDHFIEASSSHPERRGFAKLVLGDSLTREDLVCNIHTILSPLLDLCLEQSSTKNGPIEKDHRDAQLYSFIDHLSLIFKKDNAYHNFRRTATTVVWANHMFAQLQEKGTSKIGSINNEPWFRLTILVAALLRDCKHTGVSESQLKSEEHMIYLMHGGEHCQARFGFRYGLDILSGQFPDLWDDIVLGFPRFLYCMKKLESPVNHVNHTIDKQNGDRAKLKNTLLAMATVLRMASLGHFALGYKDFTEWNEAAFAELRLANLSDRGSDPTDVWNEQCVRFINAEVLPVAKQCGFWIPDVSSDLQEAVRLNLKTFKAEGRNYAKMHKFSRRNSLTSLDLDASEKSSTNIDAALNVFC